MALLQISEPGMASAPHQRRLAVGIDLGTTHSLVATIRHGLAEVLSDAGGEPLLPSAVNYGADRPALVGHAALDKKLADPANTIVSVKRLMGRGISDIQQEATTRSAYDFVEGPGMVQMRTAAGIKSPVEVSAEILAALRTRAEATLGDALVGAVITVPAYFDDAQRQATKDAAQLAGLSVLRLLNEPTAAAIAYGLDNGSEGTYAIYDLGGGTFDISILKLTRGVFEVLATGGDSALGGDDFDARIARWVREKAALTALSREEEARLLAAARQAKEALSQAEVVDCHFSYRGGVVSVSLSREAMEQCTADLVARTVGAAQRCLRDAHLSAAQIKGVVLVGGASRMPQVREAVATFFGQTPLTNLDPDQVVALGAAIQANLLAGNRAPGDDWLLLDVIPLSLGVETMGGLVEKIIVRNSTIPVARSQDFTTYKDGQSAMVIHVVQGERELVSDCRSLARFELRGIPALVAGVARIRVTYQVDADGLLSVAARELSSGVEASVAVKPSYGLEDADISRMLQDSFGAAESDMRVRAEREQKVDGERLVEATRSALAADGDLLASEERSQLERLLVAAVTALEGDDAALTRAAIDALSRGSDELAARRMDRSIRQALAGKRLDELT